MVICPCGELLDLVSARHLITMEVEDIDTCTGTDRVKADTFTQKVAYRTTHTDDPTSIRISLPAILQTL